MVQMLDIPRVSRKYAHRVPEGGGTPRQLEEVPLGTSHVRPETVDDVEDLRHGLRSRSRMVKWKGWSLRQIDKQGFRAYMLEPGDQLVKEINFDSFPLASFGYLEAHPYHLLFTWEERAVQEPSRTNLSQRAARTIAELRPNQHITLSPRGLLQPESVSLVLHRECKIYSAIRRAPRLLQQ